MRYIIIRVYSLIITLESQHFCLFLIFTVVFLNNLANRISIQLQFKPLSVDFFAVSDEALILPLHFEECLRILKDFTLEVKNIK